MNVTTRSKVGVVIGAITILGFCVAIIKIIVTLCDFKSIKEEDKKGHEDLISAFITKLYIILTICILAIIVSILLIIGIIKRRHNLMKPWIFCAIAGLVCQILHLIIAVVGGFLAAMAFSDLIKPLTFGIMLLVIQYVIFTPIHKLYKEFRDEPEILEPESTSLHSVIDSPPTYRDLEASGKLQNSFN